MSPVSTAASSHRLSCFPSARSRAVLSTLTPFKPPLEVSKCTSFLVLPGEGSQGRDQLSTPRETCVGTPCKLGDGTCVLLQPRCGYLIWDLNPLLRTQFCSLRNGFEPWPMWLSCLGVVWFNEGSLVPFSVRAHARVLGLDPW